MNPTLTTPRTCSLRGLFPKPGGTGRAGSLLEHTCLPGHSKFLLFQGKNRYFRFFKPFPATLVDTWTFLRKSAGNLRQLLKDTH